MFRLLGLGHFLFCFFLENAKIFSYYITMDTKYLLAEALKRCMKKAPLEKITIKDITDTCGVSRQTFYRHFKDRQDLVNWYFDKILLESFEHMGEGKTIYDGLVTKFTFINQEKLFLSAAFKNDDQNNLRDHDFELILAFYTHRIQEKTRHPLSDQLQFQLEMYCQGSIYMTVKWLLNGAQSSSQNLARQMVDSMPENLRQVFTDLDLL